MQEEAQITLHPTTHAAIVEKGIEEQIHQLQRVFFNKPAIMEQKIKPLREMLESMRVIKQHLPQPEPYQRQQ